MTKNSKSPIDLPVEFNRVADELERAVSQCRKPHHLNLRSFRTVAKAGRLLFKAFDDGVVPPQFSNMASLAALFTDHTGDGDCAGFISVFAIAFLKKLRPEMFNANAGVFAMDGAPKRDKKGRLLGRDGKPLKWIITGEPGKPGYSGKLSGEWAKVTDDYDEQDAMEHLRSRTIDQADTCRALAYEFRFHAQAVMVSNDVATQHGARPDAVPKASKAIEDDRSQIADFQNALHEKREKIYREAAVALSLADVPELLRLMNYEIGVWVDELDHETIALFGETDRARSGREFCSAMRGALPGFVMRTLVVATDAISLVEMAIGHSHALALARRLDGFEIRRSDFGNAMAALAATWDTKIENHFEQLHSIDRHRAELISAAYELCGYIDTLASFAAARNRTPSAPMSPIASTLPASQAKPDSGSAVISGPFSSIDAKSQRADGFYPPRTIVWRGKVHDCDPTKREMAFLSIGLRNNEIDIHELMHTNNGIVWKERYLHTKKKRNKISQFLKRLNERLVDAKPPVNLFFSLRRESDSISRTEGTNATPAVADSPMTKR